MMANKSDIRNAPDNMATHIVEMDAAAEDIHPQRYKMSIKHKHTSWTTLVDKSLPTTLLNFEDRSRLSNNDMTMRRVCILSVTWAPFLLQRLIERAIGKLWGK